jgi:hypothetical protein
MQAEDLEKLRKFNEEWDSAHTSGDLTKPIDPGIGNSSQNQGNLIDAASAGAMNMNTGPYTPPSIPTTGDKCDQCGTLHPPIKPGDICPVAQEFAQNNTAPIQEPEPNRPNPPQDRLLPEGVQPPPSPAATADVVYTVPEKPVEVQPAPPPPPIQKQPSVEPEPTPLAENNIPTEIHVNKYLNSWSDLIIAHCKTHNVVNVKRLMRHLTVEVTDFLEYNKGR